MNQESELIDIVKDVFGEDFKTPFNRLKKYQREGLMLSKNWEQSFQCRELFDRFTLGSPFESHLGDDLEMYFPNDYGKGLEKDGSWIRVKKSPGTEYTVPPFSMWFAKNWEIKNSRHLGVTPKRVKIITPLGDLGLFPQEYSVIENINEYVGLEEDGIFIRMLGGETIIASDALFYLMSRGIKKQEATIMLLNQCKSMNFCWFEMAPQYGETFGFEWPSPDRCSFATEREIFNEN